MEVENLSDNEINMNITSSESQEKISTHYLPPRKLRNKNNQSINITSDEEREFEKFILQTACDTEHGEPDLTSLQCDTSILKYIHPHMSHLEKAKLDLSSALSKARTTYDSYKKNKLISNQSSMKVQDKKERLKQIYQDLKAYEKELDNRKKQLNNNHLLRLERLKELNAEDTKLNDNATKFNIYYEKKFLLLKAILDELKVKKESNAQRNIDIIRREQELLMREEKVKYIQNEINLKKREHKEINLRRQPPNPLSNVSNKNIYIRKNSMSSYNHKRNHSHVVVSIENKDLNKCIDSHHSSYPSFNNEMNYNTYNSLDNFSYNDNHQNNQATLELINQQIAIKESELNELNKQTTELHSETLSKLAELNNRLSNAEERELEILLLKKDLQNKLIEVNNKLNETQKISQGLKQQEDYINSLRLSNRIIDNKLSTYEINEALNQTLAEISKNNHK